MKQKNKNVNHKSSLKKDKLSKYQKINKFKILKSYSFLSKNYWQEWYKTNLEKKYLFLIVMQLRNNKYDIFHISTNAQTFDYQKGTYYIDSDLKIQTKFGVMLFYHQNCSTPFKININITELMQKVRKDADDHVEKALNPVLLKGFIHSQVIEKVLKGQELTKEMEFIKKLIVINLMVSLLIGFVMAKSMGWI